MRKKKQEQNKHYYTLFSAFNFMKMESKALRQTVQCPTSVSSKNTTQWLQPAKSSTLKPKLR